ncbi:hypothetical protein AVEN_189040-1 [Araneus ventricosus]|uniref:Uncharacterized protein n=1 Tax=Araneus ventricosus TaxID=182803 RepID=A0A4Y2UUY0_ARAVE|nr:hypothetical protein AVEN_189040-1 [Araneus ventricosus]
MRMSSRTKRTEQPAYAVHCTHNAVSIDTLTHSQALLGTEILRPSLVIFKRVESCLPEEVLVAWERSRNHRLKETKESRTLEQLMNFLRQEVKGEEMVHLARTGFASHQSSRRKELHNDQVKQSESTTASGLVSLQTPVWALSSLVSVQLRRRIHHSFLIRSSEKLLCDERHSIHRRSSVRRECRKPFVWILFVEISKSPGGYFGETNLNIWPGIFTAPSTEREISGPKGSTILHR